MNVRLVIYLGADCDLSDEAVALAIGRAVDTADEDLARLLGGLELSGGALIPCLDEADAARRMEALPEGIVAALERVSGRTVQTVRRGWRTREGFVPLTANDFAAIVSAARRARRGGFFPDDPPPLLALQGVATRLDRSALGILIVITVAAPFAVTSGMVPFLWNGQGAPSPFAILATIAATVAPTIFFFAMRAPPEGYVEVYPDEILFKWAKNATDRSATRVRWDEIRAFDDGSADAVAIFLRTGGRRRIPTPTEEARTKLLALLDEKGVVRAG